MIFKAPVRVTQTPSPHHLKLSLPIPQQSVENMSHSGRQLLGSDKVTLWINEQISYKVDNTKRLVNQMKTGHDEHQDTLD